MGSRPGSTRAVVAIAAALTLAGAGVGIWLATKDKQSRIRPRERITAAELRRYPPFLLLWGRHVSQTAAGDLFIVRPDGTSLRRVRGLPARINGEDVYGVARARWSPGRKEIGLLLGWYCSGDPCFQLARISPEGDSVAMVKVPADVRKAQWSSDWRAVLTTFNGDQIWTTRMRGGKPRRIWEARGRGADAADWSPHGRDLVVTSAHGLVTMTRAGTRVRRLTHSGVDMNPLWSPDGRAIAFIRQPSCFWEADCDKPADLYLIHPDGQGLRRLTSSGDPISFVWAPDGRSIVFESQRVSGENLLVQLKRVDLADGRARTLTSGREDYGLAWSPDGRKLLFTRRATPRRGSGDELWVMDADGGRKTRLPLYRRRWTMLSADWGA